MTSSVFGSNDRYRIIGGSPVSGRLRCLGAKNFVTKAMVASLLTDQPCILTNVPAIGDVQITAEMIAAIGARVSQGEQDAGVLEIDPEDLHSSDVPIPHSGSNRIPILLLAALLHRFDRVSVPILGGCVDIGSRSVDFHISALERFGAHVLSGASGYVAKRSGPLAATQIELPYPSVGATETCLYLSVLARGRSVIRNAASEPEIFELIAMLRSMGAVIFTQPNREIIIEGVERLRGTKMDILGDRIEAASWACLAMASDGDITVDGVRPDSLGNLLSYCEKIGGGVQLVGPSSIRFFRRHSLQPTIVETDVFPGFSTDWQQPFAVVLSQAAGISVIHETVYENRFGYLRALDSLGARTQIFDACLGTIKCRFGASGVSHTAIIQGPVTLRAGVELTVPDLRAGLSYVIAAVVAEGVTVLGGVHQIERGYGDVVPRLRELGIDIERIPA